MVIECLRCWWNGLSPVPVFFDAAEFHHHKRISHQLPEYEGQEVILAVRLQRSADHILSLAVHSSFTPEIYGSREAWESAARDSEVRLSRTV